MSTLEDQEKAIVAALERLGGRLPDEESQLLMSELSAPLTARASQILPGAQIKMFDINFEVDWGSVPPTFQSLRDAVEATFREAGFTIKIHSERPEALCAFLVERNPLAGMAMLVSQCPLPNVRLASVLLGQLALN